MHITLFGAIWLTLQFFAVILPDLRYLFFLLIVGMVLQSDNVIVINNAIGVGPQLITSGLFFVKSLIYSSDVSERTGSSKLINIYTGLVIYILINSSIINSNNFNFIQILMLIVYLITTYRMKTLSSLINKSTVEKAIDFVTWFVLIEGFIALFQALKIFPNWGFLQYLIYNDTVSGICSYNVDRGLVRFMGPFLEPSYCACFLVGLLYYYVIARSEYRFRWHTIIALIVAIMLTKSSTAYGTVVVTGAVFLISRAEKKALKYIIPLGCILIIPFYSYVMNLINTVIIQKNITGSAMVRTSWNNAAWQAFLKSPIFGIGYKSQRASSLFYTIMGELGIVGMILYSYFIFTLCKHGIFNKNMTKEYCSISFWILGVIIGQFIACPDLSLCVFWLSFYVLMLYSNMELVQNMEK